MQQMAQALNGVVKDYEEISKDLDFDPVEGPLREAAGKWATHAVMTYDGKLLKRALGITRAIAQFMNELESYKKRTGAK